MSKVKLNEQQRKVVEFRNGNAVVVSSAGSGKSTVMVERVKRLVDSGVEPYKILVISFTKDTVKELKARLGKDYKDVEVSTFHGLCYKSLKQGGNKKELFFKNWLFEKHFKDLYGEVNLDEIMSWISYQKNYGYRSNSAVFAEKEIEGCEESKLIAYYKEYEAYLKKDNKMDFDDMLLEFVEKTRKNKAFRNAMSLKYDYIMVDEHQDSNGIQNEILKVLNSKGNLMCVGDPNQCIKHGELVLTENGYVEINEIKLGDNVVCAIGEGKNGLGVVENITSRYTKEYLYEITTKSGRVLNATDKHIVFSRKNGMANDCDTDLICNITNEHKRTFNRTETNNLEFKFIMFSKNLQVCSDENSKILQVSDNQNSKILQELRLVTDSEYIKTYLVSIGFNYKSVLVKGKLLWVINKYMNNQDLLLNQFLAVQAELVKMGYNVTLEQEARLATNYFDFTEVKDLLVGDKLLVDLGDCDMVEDEIVNVRKYSYSGYVYDLDIAEYRNYIVNGIYVHNCLYGFRGSDPSIILDFVKDWNGAQVFFLPINYRSTKKIVDVANEFIKQAYKGKEHMYTDAIAHNENDGDIYINHHNSPVYEIKRLITEEGVNPKDIAILYRSHYLSGEYEMGLRELEIPYNVIGQEKGFFYRPEVVNIMSYLRLAVDSTDEDSFINIYNVPNRYISKDFVAKVLKRSGDLLRDISGKPYEMKGMTDIKNVVRYVNVARNVEQAIDNIMLHTKLDREWSAQTEEGKNKLGSIKVLKAMARKFKSVSQFVYAVNNMKDKPPKNDAVTLMSVHGSKGLEFPYVFIVEVHDGIFPDKRSPYAEEINTFYVSITRPIHSLYLYGTGTFIHQINSILKNK